MPNSIEENLKKNKNKQFLWVPLAIFLGAFVLLALIVLLKPKALKETAAPRIPVVSIQQVEKKTVAIPVYSRGIITPGTEIPLVSEVQGRILSVSPNFESGAFFKKGENLFKIDSTNYKLDLAKSKSQVSKAKLNYTKVKAEVSSNRISKSSVGKARLEEAKAQLEAAQADYTRAKRLLERTTFKAPFDGRVRDKLVDVSQYITPGVQMGTIFAIDTAEIKLPLSDAQLELIKIPSKSNSDDADKKSRIILRGEYAGDEYFWYGEVIRAEGGINQKNRLLHVIAEIENPFETDKEQPNRPPLAIGKFVEVEVEGTKFNNVVVIPRTILRNTNQVLTLTADNNIEIKEVDVMHRGKENVYIRNGLDHGDWVISTQLDVVVDGMKVQLADNQKVDRLPSLTPDIKEEQKINETPPAELLPPVVETKVESSGFSEEKLQVDSLQTGEPLPEKVIEEDEKEEEIEKVAQASSDQIDKDNKTDPKDSDPTASSQPIKLLTTQSENSDYEGEGSGIILRESTMPVSLIERE